MIALNCGEYVCLESLFINVIKTRAGLILLTYYFCPELFGCTSLLQHKVNRFSNSHFWLFVYWNLFTHIHTVLLPYKLLGGVICL